MNVKNSIMNVICILIIVVSMFSIHARADSYEGYESSIQGLGMWWLDPRAIGQDNVGYGLKFGENPEYAEYCDGENKLYIYEFSSKSFRCKTALWIEFKGWDSEQSFVTHKVFENSELAQVTDLAKKEKYNNAYESEYVVELYDLEIPKQGIFTVSMKKLPRGAWKITSVSDELISKLQEIMEDKFKCPPKLSPYEKECFPIKLKAPTYPKKYKVAVDPLKIDKWAINIKEGDREVVIVPIVNILYKGPEGEDEVMIVSSVFIKTADSYHHIGDLNGELMRVGADIDNDQFPEIVVDNSLGYSQEINYVRIYPSIERLATYSHN